MSILDTLHYNTTHAVRRLLRDWRFSASATVILSLGIGANTAVFSILNNTLFQPHPYRDSQRLVNLYQNDAKTGEPEGVSYPAFLDLQQQTAVFAGVGAAYMTEGRYQTVDPQGRAGANHGALIEFVSANYLDVLGLRPSLGRWFTAGEERASAPVAVLGWKVWAREFGANPKVLGQTLNVGGNRVQVIGVAPRGLNSSQSNTLVCDIWIPATRVEPRRPANTASTILENRTNLLFQVRARLVPGVTVQRAQAAMDIAARRLAEDYPDTDPKRGIAVFATDDIRAHPREKILRPVIAAVLTVVGLVLAISCSNLATLLLVRGSERSSEISTRLALGATRWQLVRQLLMESFVLSLAGAVAGVAIAQMGLRYLATIDMPLEVSMQLDYRVLGFVVAMAVLCGVGIGLTPALQVTRHDRAQALRDQKGSSGRSLSLTRGWFTLKNTLLLGQVAASFLLLMSAALSIAVLTTTQNRSVGFPTAGLTMIETDPSFAGYDVTRARVVFTELRRRVTELPGVDSVFVTTGLPADGQFNREFMAEGAGSSDFMQVEGRWADPGYFETLGIPLLFGREFDPHDSPASQEVIVVSEAFALRFFGAPNVVGKRLRIRESKGNSRTVSIVGVARNTRSIDYVGLNPKKFFYLSAAQAGKMPTAIVARASRNEIALLSLLQQEVRRLHPELPVLAAETLEQRHAKDLVLFRAAYRALGVLGALGLFLAAVGLYSVVALAVAQRSSEIGIRVALGARPGNVIWLVVRDVTVLVFAGIAFGSVLSWTGLIVFKASVGPVMGFDPLNILLVALVIAAFGAAAAFLPARRAVQIDPIAAIRYQ